MLFGFVAIRNVVGDAHRAITDILAVGVIASTCGAVSTADTAGGAVVIGAIAIVTSITYSTCFRVRSRG